MGFLAKGQGRMTRFFIGLCVALSVWATGLDAAWSMSGSGAIFMYHRFGDERYPSTNIRMDQFKAQMDYLEAEGFTVVSLDEMVTALKRGEALPLKIVAITMDDAYATVYKNAWPLLKEKGWPFTVFVNTDGVDRRSAEYMSWDQIRELRRYGVTFGNHTASHPHLARKGAEETEAVWLARIRADVMKGEGRLYGELGTFSKFLAYPYGEYNTQVAALVADLGYVAFGQHSGAGGGLTDLKAVPRFPLSEAYGEIGAFRTKANARALPVVSMTPWEPHTRDRRPVLKVELAPSDARLDELTCYVSGQGRVEITWVVPGRVFTVRANADLPVGRHKYNITVPDQSRRRYYWFSRQWVVEG